MKVGGFQEFNLFDMTGLRMECEANIFAAQLTPKDNEFLDLCERGFDTQQIASALHSDINLVAPKADTLISQGFPPPPAGAQQQVFKISRHKSWYSMP